MMRYHVETFPIGSCVCDETGLNVTKFQDKPGAKFTTLEDAKRICDEMNAAGE